MSLDVLVADKAGKPVGGLEPTDFSLLDSGQPRKILAFRRTDGIAGNRFDPPVELIIVLDAVNQAYQPVTLERLELEKFLRQNGGQLAQPTSIFLFSSLGLHIQEVPSKDGNALAEALDHSTGTVRASGSNSDPFGMFQRFQTSIQTISGIAENEARKPGRKVLVWIGPGWPMLADPRFVQSNESRQGFYRSAISLSKKLREARIALYGIYTPNAPDGRFLYLSFLKPLQDPHKAEAAHLSLQVLATQTGGRVIDSSNDLQGQIAACIGDIGAYYTLTFAPPSANHADEYHDLKVVVDQPGPTVRTNSGYYNEP
jgi:VWFA-related protein